MTDPSVEAGHLKRITWHYAPICSLTALLIRLYQQQALEESRPTEGIEADCLPLDTGECSW